MNRPLLFSRKGRVAVAALVFFGLLIFSSMSFGDTSSPRLFRIGTGGTSGVYYPIGSIIAHGLTGWQSDEASGVPGYIGVAQNSAGSVENVRGVTSGELEAGLVQADIAAWAYKGEHVFAGDESARSLRAVASLYSEKFQIVTRKDAGIHRIQDLRGKHISIDEAGSGTLAVMRIVLEAYGMSEGDFRPVYLKPVFTQEKVVSGELDGFVMMAGAPMEAVTQLEDVGVSLVPIPEAVAARISFRYPYLVAGKVPAGVYAGIPETPTIEVHALLVVSAAMEEELAYRVTAALWSAHTLATLHAEHPLGKAITPKTAFTGISIPLHPGAKRFYTEYRNRFESPRQP